MTLICCCFVPTSHLPNLSRYLVHVQHDVFFGNQSVHL
jgi:hypothetical protein